MAAYTLPEGFSDFDMFAFGSALLVGGLLGFFLNAISILAYISVKQMRTPSNFLVFNLAVADIMLNITGLIAAYASLFHSHWPWGQDGCSNHAFMGMTAVLASISFLATIAWDRYHQYVTNQKLFWSTAWTISIITWGLAIFWAAVPLIGWGVYDFEPMRTCCTLDYTKGDKDYITYMGALTVFYLIFPAYVMKSNYDAIHAYFKKIHKHRWNTSLPLRVLLFCWGPYEIMCIYACFGNARLVSPKLRMVITKLRARGLDTILCNWILDFLTGRPQAVRIGNNTSSTLTLNTGAPRGVSSVLFCTPCSPTLTLNTGAPQGCVLSPLLYSLFTHDCTALHDSNSIIKFADDTTVIGLITNNNESAYREEGFVPSDLNCLVKLAGPQQSFVASFKIPQLLEQFWLKFRNC